MKTILVDAVNTFVVDGEIYQPLFDLLERYLNFKIIVTNANDEQMVEFGLTDMPYAVFTLKHQPDKTDRQYYYKLLEEWKLGKDDVVYFEHNPEAVESARSVGIKTFHYDKDKRDLEKLKKWLEENI